MAARQEQVIVLGEHTKMIIGEDVWKVFDEIVLQADALKKVRVFTSEDKKELAKLSLFEQIYAIGQEMAAIDGEEVRKRSYASERHWGGWYLSKSKPLSLNFYPYDNPSPYEIELTRINTYDGLLRWIHHLSHTKVWGTLNCIKGLMQAYRELTRNKEMPKLKEY